MMKYSCLCFIVLLCTVAHGGLVSRFTMDNTTNSVTSTTLFGDYGPVTFTSDAVCGYATSTNAIQASAVEPLPKNFTISVWVKLSVSRGTRYGILSTRGSRSSGIPFWGVQYSAQGVIIFELSATGSGNYIDPLAYSIDASSFSNSWHHMVFIKSGTYGIMYFDGKMVSAAYRMVYSPILNTPLMFGKDPIYASPSSILVDEYRMYDAPVDGECLYYYPCASLPCPDANGGSGTCSSSITGTYTKKCDSQSCRFNLTMTGATEPLFFQWSDGYSTYAPFRNNINESLANNLTVNVVDANNCKVTIPVGNPTPTPSPSPIPTPPPTARPNNLVNVTVTTYDEGSYCYGNVIRSESSVIPDNQCISAAGVYVRYQLLSVIPPKVCIFTDPTCNSQSKCLDFPLGCHRNGDGTSTYTLFYIVD